MNKFSFFATLVASLAVIPTACNMDDANPDTSGKREIEINAQIVSGLPTKSTVSPKENEVVVKSLQIFVFNEDGAIDGYTSEETNPATVKVRCSPGKKHVYALVNAPNEVVETEAQLKKTVSRMEDNADQKYIMVGSVNKEVNASSTVSIPVKRIAARIVLDNVIRQFTSPALAAKKMDLVSIYAVNICGDISYDLTSKPTIWYNKRKNESPAKISDLAFRAINKKDIANGSTTSVGAYLYVYPNTTTDDSFAIEFGPRKTRLIAEFTIDGKTCYYPVTFEKLEANKTYTINNLTLTRPGSSDPDSKISVEDCDFNIRVEDWGIGFSGDIQI